MPALSSRIKVWLESVLLFLAVLQLCVHTIPQSWRTLNTDFPNYYLAARLVHEGFDTSRMYEWKWLQREKDHRDIDDPVIGLVPITPISTLAVLPLASLPPLQAKHLWTILNVFLLVPVGWLLRSLTGLNYRRIALVLACSIPLHRNLLFGQYYILLLLLLTAACWAYLRERPVLSGVLVALAAALKIFPLLFVVFFLWRRQWRALAATAATTLAAAAVSIAVFGWNLHRTYLQEVFPWTMHGETLPPYATSSGSISSLLHYLFLPEPMWNPHPWHASPLAYALLLPLFQTLILAPAILLLTPSDGTRERIQMEWSTLLVAVLTVSPIPASYNFVLLALPVCVMAALLLKRRRYGWLTGLAAVYLGIGFPVPGTTGGIGLAILLRVPRLPLLLILLAGMYLWLWRGLAGTQQVGSASDAAWRPASATFSLERLAWACLLLFGMLYNMRSTWLRETAVRQEYSFRLPSQGSAYMEANPRLDGETLRSVALTLRGYRMHPYLGGSPGVDQLSFGGRPEALLVEEADARGSRIVGGVAQIQDGRDPMSAGDAIAYVHDEQGRGRLMVRTKLGSRSDSAALTAASLNVYEASFLSADEYVFAASENGRPPRIYQGKQEQTVALLDLGEARFPSLSPDGRWMAYSRMESGVWNLWLRDRRNGATRRIADVPCNQIQPSWTADSKTVVYGTDCGRSLWFTAAARRQVVPDAF